MSAGLTEHRPIGHQPRLERAEKLHFLAAHHVGAAVVEAAHAGDDRGAPRLDPLRAARDGDKIGGRRHIGNFVPAALRPDHAGAQHRGIAKARTNARRLGIETARRNRQHAAVVTFGFDHRAARVDAVHAAVGGAPVYGEKMSVHAPSDLPPGRIERDQYRDHRAACHVETGRGAKADAFGGDAVLVGGGWHQQRQADRQRERDQEHNPHAIHERDRRREHLEQIGETDRRYRRGDRPRLARALPEQAEQEDHRDTRREEARKFLDELESLVGTAEQGARRDQREQSRDHRDDAPDEHQLLLARLAPFAGMRRREFGIEVEREDRGNRIDLGGGRRHHRGHQRRKDQPQYARGQQPHHRRIGFVGFREVGRKHHRGDPRQHDDHRHQQLEKGGEHDALLRFGQALRRERTLDDILVEPPIGQVRDPHAADQHRDAGQILVEGVVGGQDHVEMPRQFAGQAAEAPDDARVTADFAERDARNQQTAQNKQRDLDDVGERDRLQPAVKLVEQRKAAEREQRDILIDPRHLVDRDRTEPHDRCEVHEDIEREPEDRHQRADVGAVALFEELRHREDLVADEDRKKKFADDQQRERRHPFVGGDRQTDRIARSRHADDLLGRNIGGDQ
eukprot:Opistho-1_new@51206